MLNAKNFLNLVASVQGNNNTVPQDDIRDLNMGAEYIPHEVTLLRRKGVKVFYEPYENVWSTRDGKTYK